MANKPPAVKITGIRGSIPSGYILGRVSAGIGDVELISQGKAQSAGLIPTSLPGPPTGAAGGDLSGTYPSPVVAQLQGRPVAATAPSNLAALLYHTSGATWLPVLLGAVAYTSAYSDLSGVPAINNVIAGGTTGQVLTKNSNTDYDLTWATPAASSGGGAASIYDDGSNLYVAVSDGDGQLVLDGSGDPVFVKEVLPTAAIPDISATYALASLRASSSIFGLAKVDNVTIQAVAGLIGTKGVAFYVTLTTPQTVTDNVLTVCNYDTSVIDTLSGYNATNGRFTPTKGGLWLFITGGRGEVATTMNLFQTHLRKSGTDVYIANSSGLSSFPTLSATAYAFAILSMNGTTDYVDVADRVQGTGGSDAISGPTVNFFAGVYLGA